MASHEEMKIQVFNGRDYSIWKKRILLYLKMKKCHEPATKNRDNENQEDWDEKNLKAMNYIYCSITNEQMEFVSNEETALNIIKKFDKLYLRESSAFGNRNQKQTR